MIQKRQKTGYPRFKGKNRYNSFTYPQRGYKFTSQSRLKLSKIGEVSIKLHRAINGEVKTLTIIKSPTNKWFACFSVQQDISPINCSGNKAIGIDLGLEKFATLSDGLVIENPHCLRKSLKLLQLKSRQLSKKKKGSCNRSKGRLRLAKLHERVYNQRLDFLHKISRRFVNGYDCIALENLKPSEMKNKHLQFSINDVSWARFKQLLSYKAEEAGVKVELVNPKGTTQKCSSCGRIVKKSLSVRIHKCPFCGLSIDRDLNAALNILQNSSFSSTLGPRGINACGIERLLSTMKQEASKF